jgi:predicted kinase
MLKLSDSCLGERHDDIAMRCQNYFYGLAEQILAAGHDVIIDYGYWLSTERINAKEYFRKRNISAELHYINKPWEIRMRQLAHRNETLIKNQSDDTGRVYLIDEELCHRLDHKFEEPTTQEYDKLIS